jgi:hypothetical protein
MTASLPSWSEFLPRLEPFLWLAMRMRFLIHVRSIVVVIFSLAAAL